MDQTSAPEHIRKRILLTNGGTKTCLAWTVLGLQTILLGVVFFSPKLEQIEKNCAIAVLGPQFSTYFAAMILYFLNHARSTKTKWSNSPISIHTFLIALLPIVLASGASFVVIHNSTAGVITEEAFTHQFLSIQSAHAFCSAMIYIHFFSAEMSAVRKLSNGKS